MNLVPSQEMTLTFDGSGLGANLFADVILEMMIVNPQKTRTLTLSCTFRWKEKLYPVYLKKATKKIQILLDEIKPLFGLKKMGTHFIVLDQSVSQHEDELKLTRRRTQYLLIKRENETLYNDLNSILFPSRPSEIKMKHKLLYKDLQKIIFFKELFRISVGFEDILIKYDQTTDTFQSLSINETVFKELGSEYKLTKKIQDTFMEGRKYVRENLLIDMFGLTEENYEEKLRKLEEEMTIIVSSCDCSEYLKLIRHVNCSIFQRMKHHFDPWRDDY